MALWTYWSSKEWMKWSSRGLRRWDFKKCLVRWRLKLRSVGVIAWRLINRLTIRIWRSRWKLRGQYSSDSKNTTIGKELRNQLCHFHAELWLQKRSRLSGVTLWERRSWNSCSFSTLESRKSNSLVFGSRLARLSLGRKLQEACSNSAAWIKSSMNWGFMPANRESSTISVSYGDRNV